MEFPNDFHPPEGAEIYNSESVNSWLHNDTYNIYAIPGVVHTLEEAEKQTTLVKGLVGSKKINFILDIRQAPPLPIDARNHYGTPEAMENINQTAVIINSNFNKVIGNFYLGIFHKSIKTKTFTSVSKAINWIEKSND